MRRTQHRAVSVSVLCLSLAALLGGDALAGPGKRVPPPPGITIQKGASFQEAMTALHRATGLAVLSEVPQLPLQLRTGLADAPLQAALDEISGSFHLYYLLGSRRLVFQRRYLELEEMPDLEVEELTAAAVQVHALVKPFTPYPLGEQETKDHIAFVEGLSPEQLKTMQSSGGLRFVELTREQQALWRRINLAQGCCGGESVFRQVRKLLSTWSSGELAYLTRPTQRDGVVRPETALWYRFPDREEPEGYGVEWMAMPSWSNARGKPGGAFGAAGESLAERKAPLRSAFKGPLLLSGTTTFGQVIAALKAATGRRIQAPAWSLARPLVAYSTTSSAMEVLMGLEDLYGWQLRPGARGSFELSRAPFRQASSHLELPRAIRAALPPAFRNLIREGSVSTLSSRDNVQRELVYAAIERKKGRDWKQVRNTELDQATQRRLANYFFGYVRSSALARSATPRWVLVAPETGTFQLGGPEYQTAAVIPRPTPGR